MIILRETLRSGPAPHGAAGVRVPSYPALWYAAWSILVACASLAPGLDAPVDRVLLAALAGSAATALSHLFQRQRIQWLETTVDALVVSIFAVCASGSAEIWQAPRTWAEIFSMTRFSSTVGIIVYLVLISIRLTAGGRSLTIPQRLSCAAVPFLFNWLLVLQSPRLLDQLGGWTSPLFSPSLSGDMGRILVLVSFNILLAGMIHQIVVGRWLKDLRLHALLTAGAVLAVFTPHMADMGSSPLLLSQPASCGILGAIASSMASQAGLWAQVYLLTGILMDALGGRRPCPYWGGIHYASGFVKGLVYGGVFMALIHGASCLIGLPAFRDYAFDHPLLTSILLCAATFPLAKTVMETFDVSERFFTRLVRACMDPILYIRGAAVGAGMGYCLLGGLFGSSDGARFLTGFAIGSTAYALVDLARDALAIFVLQRRTAFHAIRVYGLQAVVGGLIGGAVAWYLDPSQLETIWERFLDYASIHFSAQGKAPEPYVIYPLFSKWGAMDLGVVSGGTRLFYDQSLAGVINWSIAAPLFSVNLVFLKALFQRDSTPIRSLFSRAGVQDLVEQAVRVQRWGLWMAPVIFSFLRMSPDPTWYNQDGAIRTLAAVEKYLTLSPQDFRSWSLSFFTKLLAWDWLRVLVWFDHMGLRVATLVNLSFVAGDLLDEKAASFLGYRMRTRCLPEAVRRFATWAPLLIPFYIPRGWEWDVAWTGAEVLQKAPDAWTPSPEGVVLFLFCAASLTGGFFLAMRTKKGGRDMCRGKGMERYHAISNGVYTLSISPDGRGWSRAYRIGHGKGIEIDLTRRPEEPLEPLGRTFHVLDRGCPAVNGNRAWTIPFGGVEEVSTNSVRFVATKDEIHADTTVTVHDGDPVEIWRVRLTNKKDVPRSIELTTCWEPAMIDPGISLRQTFFNRLHIGTCFIRPLSALFATNRLLENGRERTWNWPFRAPEMTLLKRIGIVWEWFLPSAEMTVPGRRGKVSPETFFHAVKETGAVTLVGYEDSLSRFLGHGTLSHPSSLGEKLRDPGDEGLLYTFDPVLSLRVRVDLPALGAAEVLFLGGYGSDLETAQELVIKHLGLSPDARKKASSSFARPRYASPFRPLPLLPFPNEVRAGDETLPPFSFSEDGTELRLGWDTPRAWSHVLANETGTGAVITNDGNIYSFFGNSQQNGLTPSHRDAITAQVPGQIILLRDLDTGMIFSPTFIPYRETDSGYRVCYGTGYAVFEKETSWASTRLSICVPPDDPCEVRILTIRNPGERPIRLRVLCSSRMVLGETSLDTQGKIQTASSPDGRILFFKNPENAFVHGDAFVGTSLPVDRYETVLSRFVGGCGRDLADPYFLEHGVPDETQEDDGFRVAAFSCDIEIPSKGEATFSIVIGQTGSREDAERLARTYQDVNAAQRALEQTRKWWRETLSVLQVETDEPAFDRMVNTWLPYQILVSRLWGRCGMMQRSGGFGYRDQLQDVIPLCFTHPDMARNQILLHAARQFVEGDVLHWWHEGPDGGAGLGGRNRSSDPNLWLPSVVLAYLDATGDCSILDEEVPYIEGRPIPKGEEGITQVPRPSREISSLYGHCVKAIDYALARFGRHGLPLIGAGDWNDGFNALGACGRGESGWLACFLYDILVRFTKISMERGDHARGNNYLERSHGLETSFQAMWRGDRYVRAITDRGEELTLASALMAAWPVISGIAGFEQGAIAVETALGELERNGLVRLFWPPFTENSVIRPGRIANYPPGVRENGGQYCHGVSWLVDALMILSRKGRELGLHGRAECYRERAASLWLTISPLSHTLPDRFSTYGLPPHQQSADIYTGPGYEGRGGWSWYTGAAARMLTAAYTLIGIEMLGGRLHVREDTWEKDGSLRLKGLVFKGKRIRGA